MQSQFKKVSQIAMITAVIVAVYSMIVPNGNYYASQNDNIDTLALEEQSNQAVSEDLHATANTQETVSSNESKSSNKQDTKRTKKTKPKKKAKKKVKTIPFSKVLAGDDFKQMKSFFNKLYDLKQDSTSKIRIAYFGDSISEADLCSSTLRAELQKEFGGQGVGFVPAVAEVSKYRRSIYHKFSKNWKEYKLVKKKDRKYPIGLTGNVAIPAIPKEDSTGYVKSSISSHSFKIRNKKPISCPTLVVLNEKENCDIEYIINASDTLRMTIETSIDFQYISLADSVLNSIEISYFPQDTIYVYGVDLSTDVGVYVDNYSIRGNRGNNFNKFNQDMLESFTSNFDYDLVIMHYGANVAGPGYYQYAPYRNSMIKNIKLLRDYIDNTPILIYSMADRGAKKDSTWVSMPSIAHLIKEQQRIAKDTNSSFWNILAALGGENCNVDLVKNGYMKKDHTHFTRKGSMYFGKLTFKRIMKEYNKYLKQEGI
jgi:lysophospholipase L1-like esterase